MSWLPTVIAAIVSLVSVFEPTIQGWISANPSVAAVIAGIAAITAALLKSPVSK